MTIAEFRGKCKNLLERIPRDVLVLAVLVFSSVLSFIFGYLAGADGRQGSPASPAAALTAAPEDATGKFVASRSGSKYYPAGCAGASRISDANKIWFVTAGEAEAAGYSLSSTCKAP